MVNFRDAGIDPKTIKIGKIAIDVIRRFIDLEDTPQNYEGQAGKTLTVNQDESGIQEWKPCL